MNKRNLLHIIASSGLILGGAHIAETQEPPDHDIVQRLQDDDGWLDRIIDEMYNAKDGKIMTEFEFFSNLQHNLMFANNHIVFRGYDAKFMEWAAGSGMVEALTVPVMRGVHIYALLPEGLGLDTSLDRLYREISDDPIFSKKAGNIVIIRTPKPMDKGYILISDLAVSVWDSTLPSVSETASYFRAFEFNLNLNNLFGRRFLIETGQDSVYSNLPNSQGSSLFPKLEYFK